MWTPKRWVAVALCVAIAAAMPGGAGAATATLLAPSKGHVPNDTNADPQVSLAEQAELGGPCLKVVFTQGSSVGETRPKVVDWTPYRTLKFDAFNPSKEIVSLTLCIRHKGTTGYPTRADSALMLKPGKNAIAIALGDITNVDGSRPDFSAVRHWYIACEAANTTVLFGDFTLEGDEAARVPAGAPAPGSAPAQGAAPAPGAPAAPAGPVRITGKVGDMAVDLTVTGLGGAPAGAPAAPSAPAPGQPATAPAPAARVKTTLLAVSKGSMPNDTNGDLKVALDDNADLGGVCLKVAFTKGSSFGMSRAGLKDWRGYANLRFTAVNPGKTPVPVQLTIRHEGSKSYGTRVDKDLVLAPGKSETVVPIAGAANNDGSAADLSAVRQWYISCNSDATVLFGDFILEGGK